MSQTSSGKDKQVSKAQSRNVSGSGPKKTAPTKAGGRSTSTLLTWGAVGVVILIVIGLVIYWLSGGKTSTNGGGGGGFQAAPDSLVHQLAHIPANVYDTVGVTSSATPINPPTKTTGQAPLTFTNSAGVAKPGVLYYGAEYCPYCAAERWAVVAALSRFGTFSNLGLTASSATDAFPNTPSFTFVKATMASELLAFQGVEAFGNVQLANGSYPQLQKPTKDQIKTVAKYDTTTYFRNGSNGGIPFISIANQFLVSGASYSPSILSGLTREQIAGGLTDATNPATQAIVATANYLSAAICTTTNQQPSAVCTSKGVKAAATAMKL